MDIKPNETAAELNTLDIPIPQKGLSFEEALAFLILVVVAVFLQWIPLSCGTVVQNQRNHKKIKKVLLEKKSSHGTWKKFNKVSIFHFFLS